MSTISIKSIVGMLFLSLLLALTNNCGGSGGGGSSSGGGATCTDSDVDGHFAQDGCGATVDCDDSDPNNWISCDTCLDDDLDGFYTGCDDYTGLGETEDCNDGDASIHPGAIELCDGIDNQCPGDPFYGSVDVACMALIPAGCFNMGDAFSEGNSSELPVHNVCITSDFYMDAHGVTNAEYAACVSGGGCIAPNNSSSSTRGSYYGNPTYDNFPVIYVNWNQATAYCAGAGKRLPTEAEWEYAARGGLSGKRYPWGDSISYSDANYDWFIDDTSAVESYAGNGYGLYDMAGNVLEWVNDWYLSTYYSVSPTNDPPGPDTGSSRVFRGGSYDSIAWSLRVACRGDIGPASQTCDHGFRCAGD
ncbi:MAG TPA: SUMF1/EgtB/PvdO family nonheme iron enzyme [bacterium]|nr:SUMF1/EgtB/PvdO family nonheme iron enzyme [bacterium]